MVVIEKEITPILKDFPKYKVLDEVKERAKKEVDLFTTLETVQDPVQKQRNIKNWKQTMGYYLLHPEKFKFGLKDLK